MSRVFAIETATEQSSIALVDGDDLVFELSLRHGRDLSRLLAPAIQHCFELSGRSLKDLDAITASVGPGSFTGLRIGVTTAKTLAFALGIPTVGVSTLRALALGRPMETGRVVVSLVDARRKEVFAAAFLKENNGLRQVREDGIVTVAVLEQYLEEVAAEHGIQDAGQEAQPAVIVAAGSPGTFLEELPDGRTVEPLYPQARDVARWGQAALVRGDTTRPQDLTPIYLRRSYAEEKADVDREQSKQGERHDTE